MAEEHRLEEIKDMTGLLTFEGERVVDRVASWERILENSNLNEFRREVKESVDRTSGGWRAKRGREEKRRVHLVEGGRGE